MIVFTTSKNMKIKIYKTLDKWKQAYSRYCTMSF